MSRNYKGLRETLKIHFQKRIKTSEMGKSKKKKKMGEKYKGRLLNKLVCLFL